MAIAINEKRVILHHAESPYLSKRFTEHSAETNSKHLELMFLIKCLLKKAKILRLIE